MSQATEGGCERDLMNLKFEYAWRHFSLHARQRVQMFNFFLLGSSFLASGYGLLVREQLYVPAFVLALVGILVGIASIILDVRNARLVDLGEAALMSVEQEYLIGEATGKAQKTAIMSYEECYKAPEWWQKHKTVIRTLEGSAIIAFAGAAGYALWLELASC